MDSLIQTSTQESAHGGVCIDIKRTQNLGDPTRIVSQICVPLLLLLGIVDAWAGKGSYLWGDSVSYVDMARGIAAGNLAATVNGLWSPLYPLLLAIFIRPFESSVAAEFCVVRVINFAIFLFSLVNFSIFLNRFVEYYVSSFGEVNSQRVHPSTWEFTLIAYSLFGWSYFALNEVSSVSPDSLVAGLTYALLAVLLSFAKGNLSWTNFIGFGMLLAIGYYAKVILLPIGLLCIAAAWSLPQARSVLARLLVSITIFIVLVAPMATALSLNITCSRLEKAEDLTMCGM